MRSLLYLFSASSVSLPVWRRLRGGDTEEPGMKGDFVGARTGVRVGVGLRDELSASGADLTRAENFSYTCRLVASLLVPSWTVNWSSTSPDTTLVFLPGLLLFRGNHLGSCSVFSLAKISSRAGSNSPR